MLLIARVQGLDRWWEEARNITRVISQQRTIDRYANNFGIAYLLFCCVRAVRHPRSHFFYTIKSFLSSSFMSARAWSQ